eukprot:sb/3476307/
MSILSMFLNFESFSVGSIVFTGYNAAIGPRFTGILGEWVLPSILGSNSLVSYIGLSSLYVPSEDTRSSAGLSVASGEGESPPTAFLSLPRTTLQLNVNDVFLREETFANVNNQLELVI